MALTYGSPYEHRRVHFHVQKEIFNIREHLMESLDDAWMITGTYSTLYADEKGERRFQDNDFPPWVWRAVSLWLYKGELSGHELLESWMGTIPEDPLLGLWEFKT
jgi:hypothetical protein